MSINTPSGSDGQNPWRRQRTEEGPPDLIQLVKKFFLGNTQKKLPFNKKINSVPTPINMLSIIGLTLLVLTIAWLLAGFYLVEPAEQAVVLRLGHYVKTVGPGPHWLIRFIENERKVNVQRIDSFPYHADMLTQDENIVSVRLQVQYRIASPSNYLFNVVSPEKTLQQAVSSALRQVVGQMALDPLITTGRQLLTDQVTSQLVNILSQYQTGIDIVDVALQEVKPPNAVTEAFDDVIKAREDRQSYINKAYAYAKNRVLTANGIGARLEQEANAYCYTVVAKAQGETARYTALLKPYQESPAIMRERLYLDTMATVLAKTHTVLVDDQGSNHLIYLPLNHLFNKRVSDIKSVDTLTESAHNDDDINNDVNSINSESTAVNAIPNKFAYPERPSYSNAWGQ